MKVEIDVDKFLADNCDDSFYEHASSVATALLNQDIQKIYTTSLTGLKNINY